MIDKEDFDMIVKFDCNNPAMRESILSNPNEKLEVRQQFEEQQWPPYLRFY